MEVKGESTTNIKIKEKKQTVKFIVVNENIQPILGKNTCVRLGFIQRIETIDKDIFKGIGCVKGFKYDIDLKENPRLITQPPRKIPYALKNAVKTELDRMTKMDIIEPITEPTPAVSPMVIVRQKGKIRICIDPSNINQIVKRRHYPLKTLEEIAANIINSKWFTLLDCKKGFWQIRVTERTSKYLTFATPWGRYICKRLPFGLASAPEVFQQIMNKILEYLPGVECSMDDILIHAETRDELKKRTTVVLDKLKTAGLKLNEDKCHFMKNKIKFLGYVLTSNGIEPDPEKIKSISQLKTPTNIKQLQRLLGMITYLSKFIINFSEQTAPLRHLLSKKVEWHWDQQHREAFTKLLNQIKKLPSLGYYNPQEKVVLSMDASSRAVGAVLLQRNRPIAFSAKALTPTQQNYSQIEKEMLAIVIGCRKFHEYVWGNKGLEIETDHKPLEVIFKKNIHEIPARLQRMRLEVLPYNPVVKYIKGSELYVADTLSRDCELKVEPEEENKLEVHVIIPLSKNKTIQLKEEINKNEELKQLKEQILKGWLNKQSEIVPILQIYWTFREQLSCYENIIF